MDQTVETLLKELTEKALAKKESGFFVGLLLSVVISIGVFFLTRRLNAQAQELARLKAQAEIDRLDAKNAVHQSMVTVIESDRRAAEERASIHLMAVKENQEMLDAMAQKHAAQIEAVEAIKQNDWDALNKRAGVQ